MITGDWSLICEYSLDVIVRGELVERAKAGDKCIFTGTLIVVPDTSAFRTPGTSVESQRDTNTRPREGVANEGVTGLKALGVRDLTYRLAFLACMVQPATHSKVCSCFCNHIWANVLTSCCLPYRQQLPIYMALTKKTNRRSKCCPILLKVRSTNWSKWCKILLSTQSYTAVLLLMSLVGTSVLVRMCKKYIKPSA